MASEPLFESQRMQRRAVAALMIGVFLCAMAGAYALTLVRAGGTALARPVPTVGPANGLGLGERWQRDPETEQQLGLGSAQVYRDAERPTRVLVVAPLAVPQPVSPAAVLEAALPRLLSPEQLETLKLLPVPPPEQPNPVLVAELVGVSQTPDGDIAQHLAALLTTDARAYWLLYLTDLGTPDETEPLLETNLRAFRALHRSVTLQPRG